MKMSMALEEPWYVQVYTKIMKQQDLEEPWKSLQLWTNQDGKVWFYVIILLLGKYAKYSLFLFFLVFFLHKSYIKYMNTKKK